MPVDRDLLDLFEDRLGIMADEFLCRLPQLGQAVERGHTDPEEFIKIGREDPQEFDTLHQGDIGIGRLLEHAVVERQPADFLVGEFFHGSIPIKMPIGALQPLCRLR